MTEQTGQSGKIGKRVWRFVDSAEDGEVWLKSPKLVQSYVDYETREPDGHRTWRRVMVVTKAWLESHLSAVRSSDGVPLWVGLPSMIVLPDAAGEELRSAVDAVINHGGFDMYATILTSDIAG